MTLPLRADPVQPAVTDVEYAKFCEFFYRKTGIHFIEAKKYYVERRLQDAILKTGATSFRDYFQFLRFQASGEELQRLVNAMTVNETYFLREDYQFDTLVREVLPSLTRARRPGRPIRIWSMPCSSGEEPYSIALIILERWGQADAWDIEILASDIDSGILAKARAGLFGPRSLSRVPPGWIDRYFSRREEGAYQICDELRHSIDFSLCNVTDRTQTARFRDLDVIFCRNMLIYFDDAARRETVEMFYEALAPGGFVFLGHSESMSRISPIFTPRRFGDTILYQKPWE
ncbi:CheR family methyltransferase [Phaeospirillum tilakii]|uniref:Chemotaxis protein methyltransferase n=1 Tax=Phaeospirillum tilakii TaxID=741673 RepID=A0ABW5CFX1_9PROT